MLPRVFAMAAYKNMIMTTNISIKNLPYMFSSQEIALQGMLDEVQFGSVRLNIVNGRIREDKKPKLKYTRRPDSGDQPIRAPTSRLPDRATQKLLSHMFKLRGEWQIKIKVADSRPQIWKMKKIEG